MSAFRKGVFRQISGNKRRFAAMFLMGALGVAFFAGIRSTGNDMRRTLDAYFDEYRGSDIQIISTMGFDEDDLAAVRAADGVESVQPVYTADGFLGTDDGTPVLTHFQSVDREALTQTPDTVLNRPELVEGSYPASASECLVDRLLARSSGIQAGDVVTVVTQGDEGIADDLSRLQYTVSGIVNSTEYIAYERGSTSKGNGSLVGYVLLPQENFTMDVYTQAFLQGKDGGNSRFSDEYVAAADALADTLKAAGAARGPARLAALKQEGEDKLESVRQEVAGAQARLTDAEREIDDAKQRLADGKRQLDDGREAYNRQLADAEAALTEGQAQLAASKNTLDEKRKELDDGQEAFGQAERELAAQEQPLKEAAAQLATLETAIGTLTLQRDALAEDNPQREALAQQIAALQAQWEAGNAELSAGRARLDKGRAALEIQKQALAAGRAALEQGEKDYEAGRAEWEKNRAAMETARREGAERLAAEEQRLNEAQKTLEDSESAYTSEKSDAQKKIEDARQEIADGERKLAELKEPEWYVLTLRQNSGFAGFEQDADRIDAIGMVFPLIFFLVAALVSLTNMTRMVEDDRSVIGVLKALGYGRGAIASRYLVYAAAAAVGGGALGVAGGSLLFPTIIFNAYRIMYTLPPAVTPVNWNWALLAGAGALLCTVLPAYLVCQSELFSTPAALMRPRAPKEGKRILLERVPFVWKRIGFSGKVTCRNIFRYKKRLLMTVIGIAGCTALVFTGFGLKNAIRNMVPLQFEKIQKYDLSVTLADDASADDRAGIQTLLEDSPSVKQTLAAYRKDYEFSGDKRAVSAGLIVPLEDNGAFERFITLRERVGGKPLSLTDDGVILSEKLAKLLGVKAGGTVEMGTSGGRTVQVRVAGITENYLLHYAYMTQALYASLYGEKPTLNSVFGQLNSTDKATEDRLSEQLLAQSGVSQISINTDLRSNFNKMIRALDAVTLVLIVSAAALAFVVLFSLTSINIDERKRELATLKVLGFYDGETAMYLYRENIVLTLLGIAAGLVLGAWMLGFVLSTAEVDLVMFARRVGAFDYAASALLTAAFAVGVNLLMSRTIRRIDMVESLKSAE